MTSVVVPHIFDWIFFDDSSELKNLAVLIYTKVGNKMSTQGRISTTDWLGICDISPAWAFVLLIRVKGSQGLEFGISKCSACAFLWTYPEIQSFWIDHLWHSSPPARRRHTMPNSLANGQSPYVKLTRLLSVVSIPLSKKKFYTFFSIANNP